MKLCDNVLIVNKLRIYTRRLLLFEISKTKVLRVYAKPDCDCELLCKV